MDASNADTASQPPAPNEISDQVALKSLAPQYDDDQHKTYLDRLEEAVEDPKNRNIALSGRYGTGKSSVLDKFEEHRKRSTLRLAMPTLAPDTEKSTLTNRIQREVLKQLVYSAEPRTLRHSRFRRPVPLPWWRAPVESALFVAVLGGILALLGYLPAPVIADAGHPAIVRIAGWLGLGLLATVLCTVVRRVTYNRFIVAGVSAAGTTLSLSQPTNTYFDEHLDEIIYFFDQEPKDIVVFEDLDRYNDPHIFQALRELNILLNNTPKRRKKITKHARPLRFLYAMRDSLFEKIDQDTAHESADAAFAETVRANRTKFFDVVIPLVPFISHRTAREHLHQLLQKANITDIDRTLVELVAKHATDMRLLLNMRNEYLVFADRLLKPDKSAPELYPHHLFALVAYKSFHLEDFENISRRSSDLDRLYDYHRDLVDKAIAHRNQTKRDLRAENTPPPAISQLAQRLGTLLITVGKLAQDQHQGRASRHLRFVVGSTAYDSDKVTTPAFWEAVVAEPTITIQMSQNRQGGGEQNPLTTLKQSTLKDLFPEIMNGKWAGRKTESVQDRLHQLDHEITKLRGADFRELSQDDEFTLPISDETEEVPFGELVDRTLKSKLARDLVKHGYIDRNFPLYAAQFYGEFTGADVARFIVQTVQTNKMDIHYEFTSPGALANLLAETDEDFTRTISAYNVQLVDYLLVEDLKRADEVVKQLTTNFGDEAERFLAAFFTSDGQRTRLAARLSHALWREVFTYLVADEGVPTDVRPALVDAALVAADPDGDYVLNSEVADFIVAHYENMPAFTEPHSRTKLDTVVTMLQRAEVLLPRLAPVHEELRTLVVANNLYELTAENLRTALDITGEVSLDQVRNSNDTVYHYCLAYLDAYLDAVDADDDTEHSVRTPPMLIEALQEADEDDTTVARLTTTASPDSSLPRLTNTPASTWPALAEAKLFRASLANLDAYRTEIGDIDENLGALLLSAGTLHTGEGDTEESEATDDAAEDGTPDKTAAAVAILNARRGIPPPEKRVQLVRNLKLEGPLSATQITPEESNLFALLLDHGLVSDDATTFAHLRKAGWAALQPAIVASNNIETFLTPALVDGMVAELFTTPETRSKIGQHVLQSLPDFLPDDNSEALAAAGHFAVTSNTALPLEQIRRVATACKDAHLTVSLLQAAHPAASNIVDVLNELGGKYSNLTSWENDEFDVPRDEAHRAVFETLHEADLCQVRERRSKDLLTVKRP